MTGEEKHVDDQKIIELYWERKENAIQETSRKYGGLVTRIAQNVLSSHEDCEECVNDTYFGMPFRTKDPICFLPLSAGSQEIWH